MDYKKLQIYENKDWIWQLHDNQCYIGRMIFVLKREEYGSFADLKLREWISLREQIILYKLIIDNIFKPDRITFSQMGNIWNQLHVHAVPRYKTVRWWKDKRFIDSRWGRNHSPKPPSPLNEKELYEFALWFKQRMQDELSRVEDEVLHVG